MAKPLSMKHTVATIDRGERRDRPHTPWPLVQPDPYRVPMPTNTPATISPNQPLLNSICGSVANKPHSSGAMSRPRRKSTFSLTPSLPRCKRLPIRPLMPAIRPLATTNRLAARPINAPPARDDQGVKLSQSTFMWILRREIVDRGGG